HRDPVVLRPCRRIRRPRAARERRGPVVSHVTEFATSEAGRLDLAVIGRLPELSRSQVRRLIEDGKVTVDGQAVVKAGVSVAAGAAVRVEEPTLHDLDLAAADIPLDVLYEDEQTLVLNKQPGLVVHPREGVHEPTLI